MSDRTARKERLSPGTGNRITKGLVVRLLGAAVLLTCAGMTVRTYRGDGTSINAYLFMTEGFSHGTSRQIEQVAMGAVMALSLVGLAWPRWPVLAPAVIYVLAESLAGWHEGGHRFSNWTPFAHAPRYLTPLALILLAGAANNGDFARHWGWKTGGWALRIGVAMAFFVHGMQALRLDPHFIDLIISTAANLLDVRPSQSTTSAILGVIGVVDIAVAVAVLIRPWPAVLFWAAFWGAVTAASRMTAFGWGWYPEVLVRSTHVLTPLALWLITRESESPADMQKVNAVIANFVPGRDRPG